MLVTGPVAPIPPSFSPLGRLRTEDVKPYMRFLADGGIQTFMTTEGTSQFALLSQDEIREFNNACRTAARILGKTLVVGLPPLPDRMLATEIDAANHHDNPIMLIYPDRHYNDRHVADHFLTAANISRNPVLVHGRPMKGASGQVDFSPQLVAILAQHPTIRGMKEECSTLAASAAMMAAAPHFSFIVAGGSCGRFHTLRSAGATAFLSGMGSFAPTLETRFRSADTPTIDAILAKEKRFFNIFMDIGWHKAMREALRQMGFLSGNRPPFPDASKAESERIAAALAILVEP